MATQYLSKAGLERLLSILTNTFVVKEDGKGLFSGSYTDLTNKPTKLSEFENDIDIANLDSLTAKYLTKDDAATTYIAKTDYDTKMAELEKADTDNLATAKTYAEEKASAAQTAATEAAKTYADSTFTTKTDYNAKVAELVQADTDNLAAAKTYAEEKATAAETAAKTYADDTFVTKTTYDAKVALLDKADTDNLAAAKQYTDDAVGAITGFDFQIVDTLPQTGTKGVIYLVPAEVDANVETDINEYDEYLWITDKFEHIGSTKMDLTGYLKEVDIAIITNDEIDQVCTAAGLVVPTTGETV